MKGGAKSGGACEHWDRLGEDLELIQGLGVGSYRFARAGACLNRRRKRSFGGFSC